MTQAKPIWEREGDEKATSVQRMFADLAPSYDRLNGLMSLSAHRRWRRAAVAQLKLQPGDHVLDLCCGTGDFIPPLAKAVGSSGSVLGVDFCAPMLELAAEKAVPGELALGDACHLALASERFEAVTVGWGIRNVPDIDLAHREIFRVLKPGGRFVSLDMARPKNWLIRNVSERSLRLILPLLGSIKGLQEGYTYLPESAVRFRSREGLSASMAEAGFTSVRTLDFALGNICLHYGEKPL